MRVKSGRIFLVSAILSSGLTLSAVAQNAVKMTSGDDVAYFMLSDQPSVTIEDNSIVVQTENEKVSCDLAGGVKFEFANVENNSVDRIETDAPVFKINPGFIEGYNLSGASRFEVADLSGKVLKNGKADESGYLYVSISELPGGIYIFNSKDKKFKFYKK